MTKRFTGNLFGSFLALAVMLAGAAFAQDEQKIEFYLDGKVGTELVKKGNYKIVIPEAEQGKVEIKVGKKVVAANYTKRALPAAVEADKMTYRDNGDGTRSVATIAPRGKKFMLVLEETNVASKDKE